MSVHRLTDEWIGIGADPTFVKLVLVDLPPANLFTLRLLVRVWCCQRAACSIEISIDLLLLTKMSAC